MSTLTDASARTSPPFATVDQDREVDDPEQRLVARALAMNEQLERRIRALEAGAFGLELLDQVGAGPGGSMTPSS